ncbi:lytic transglycosylase domain-containing protein [Streptomyces formicae]|uniref:Lytic transglycosylase domain-containing protein n=1 Tax=Streptomyces formicae TaxID=1616117 RepID=A0ABY3WSI6_9ACTN|nr:lytic transglycosylase domain-containing protein [Streptomyces formicae]UNM14439.1 lytic transglycosylase domain-containing protein [Streptomyces formicae]
MAAQFGRRLRKGATTTAVAAAAVAALSASQAPGVTPAPAGGDGSTSGSATPPESSATGNSPYYTDLPPLNTPNKPGGSINLPVATGPAEAGIPATVLNAYKQAEAALAAADPACRLPWQLLAAIGKVESGQARGGRVDANGTTTSPILGPVLNGVGFANISDTDDGAYDGDRTHDRAVGPMQFIPSTWAGWGQDGNDDGRKDPNNIYDAALAAGKYLCAGGRDLSVQSDLDRAILSYNHSQEYLRTVLSWFEYYKRGTHQVPDGTGVLPVDRSDGSTGASPSPTAPVTPGPSPSPSPSPSQPGGTPSPTPPPTTPPPTPGGGTTTPPAPSPSPTETVTVVEDAAGGQLTAVAGQEFTQPVKVRAKNARGLAVPGAGLVFEVVGETDARFSGDRRTVAVRTGADGIAVAPALLAGERTGDFTVRVTVAGRAAPRLDRTATVTPRQADELTRTGDKELTAAPGAEFADAVEVKATFKGAAAAGVAVTATMITAADDPAENTKGPYFKDAEGNPVRTLTELKTGADGALVLPKIYADDQTGTFLLRLTTPGGATLTIQLQIAAPTEPSAPATPAP